MKKTSESLRFLGTCSLTKPMYEVRISCFFCVYMANPAGFSFRCLEKIEKIDIFTNRKSWVSDEIWPASSMRDFYPNGGDLAPLKGSLKTPKQVTGHLHIWFLRSIFGESLAFPTHNCCHLGLGRRWFGVMHTDGIGGWNLVMFKCNPPKTGICLVGDFLDGYYPGIHHHFFTTIWENMLEFVPSITCVIFICASSRCREPLQKDPGG